MRPVTAAFRAAVQRSHRLAVRVDVLSNGVVLDTISTVTDGTVTLDANAQVRGRCDLSIADDGSLGLVPSGPADLLAPYGNELQIHRGVMWPDGGSELVSLGIFRIDDADVQDAAGSLLIAVTGQDRTCRIIDARFEEPFQVAAGTNVITAITNTITPAMPDVVIIAGATAATTPALIAEEGADRWEFATKLAKSIGCRPYFNGDGHLVIAPEVIDGPAAVTLAEGTDGVLVSAGRKWGRAGAFNRVIATGENVGEAAPARGVATDDNPQSPTYYYGPFGKVPRWYASPFLATDEQAADAAAAILARETGTTQSVSLGTLVLPHLEPGDIAQITRHRVRVNERHVLDAVTIPLAATGTMSCATRAIPGQAYVPEVLMDDAAPMDAALEADTMLDADTFLSAIGVAA